MSNIQDQRANILAQVREMKKLAAEDRDLPMMHKFLLLEMRLIGIELDSAPIEPPLDKSSARDTLRAKIDALNLHHSSAQEGDVD